MPNNEPNYYCGQTTIIGNTSLNAKVKYADPLNYSDLNQAIAEVNIMAQQLQIPQPTFNQNSTFCDLYAEVQAKKKQLQKAINAINESSGIIL